MSVTVHLMNPHSLMSMEQIIVEHDYQLACCLSPVHRHSLWIEGISYFSFTNQLLFSTDGLVHKLL